MSDAPIVDGRDGEEILEDARGRARHYTAEWDPDSADVGSALLGLFSSMAEDVTERLDRVPDKHRIAFFDALGFDRRPPQPARLPLTFEITDDVDENVAIPGGTRAVAPARGARPEQLFELPEGDGFEGTPANLAAVYTVAPGADDVFEHWGALAAGGDSQLFAGADLQEHALCIGHADVLNLKQGSSIWVTLRTSGLAVVAAGGEREPSVFEHPLKWEFYGEVATEDGEEEGWHPLEVFTVESTTSEGEGTPGSNATTTEEMTLRLGLPGGPAGEGAETGTTETEGGGPTVETAETTDTEIGGIECRWIRCRVPTDEEFGDEGEPQDLFDAEIRSVTLSLVAPTDESIGGTPPSVALDEVLSGDVPLEVEPDGSVADLSPFGETWPLRNAFYVACEEAFTKPGVTVELAFDGAVRPTGSATGQPSVSLGERGPVGSTVFVETASLPEGGVILVRDDTEAVLGAVALDPGTYENVPIPLGSPLPEEPRTLRVELRRELAEEGPPLAVDEAESGPTIPDADRDPRLSWEYWNGEGWALLGELDDRTTELRSAGTVSFTVPEDLEPTAVAGHGGHWIRARIVGGEYVRLAYDTAEALEETVSASVVGVPPRFERASLRYVRDESAGDGSWRTTREPDHLVTHNNLSASADLAGSLGSGLEPFYGLADEKATMYLGFDAELRDGPINVLFSLADEAFPGEFYPRVRWEYRVSPESDEWATIEVEDGTEDLTRGGIVSLVLAEPTVRSERFGRDLHWIRARIDGQEFVPAVGEDETADPAALPVVLEEIDGRERRIVLVNTSVEGVDLEGYRLEFECAEADDRTRTFEAGATIPPRGARIVRERAEGSEFPIGSGDAAAERFVFESLPLDARVRNAVGLRAPDGTVVTRRVEGEPEPCERWLDTVPPAGEPDRTPPVVLGIHPNTGWVYNVTTVDGEHLGASDGTPGQTFAVSSPPVTEETVRVNELSTLSEAERADLLEADPSAVEEVTGAGGDPVALWVRWTRVEDLLDSDAGDRHYVLDPMAGRFTFGDGTRGRIPPRNADSVRVDYRTGGGSAGNVPAGAVGELVSTIPFVDSVSNPEPGDAGADAESVDAVVARAPSELRDRGRAVSKADFERIAMAASRKLARVRCIPAMDDAGEYGPGWVTLLIVPNDARPKPVPSTELRRRVAEAVSGHAPATLVAHGDAPPGSDPALAPELVVRGPSYVEVSVGTTIRAGDVDSISALESRVTRGIDAFLHPLTGGETGEGWRFGELPCLSDLYALLEGIAGVDHVVDLSLTFRGGGESETIGDGEETPSVAADTLAFGGEHGVEIEGTSGGAGTGRNPWD